jgi:hypothetical protein
MFQFAPATTVANFSSSWIAESGASTSIWKGNSQNVICEPSRTPGCGDGRGGEETWLKRGRETVLCGGPAATPRHFLKPDPTAGRAEGRIAARWHGAICDGQEKARRGHVDAFSHAARNFAIASSRVAAVPFVTPGVAGVMKTDQNQRMSGGVLADGSS